MQRADGEMTVVHGSTVTGGLTRPGDVLINLLAHGLTIDDAEHCVEELEPGFDARAEVARRSEIDMAAGRVADHLRREELKAQFRQNRGH